MDKDGTLLYSFSFFPLHRNQTLERTQYASIYIFSEVRSKEESCLNSYSKPAPGTAVSSSSGGLYIS